MLLTDRKTFVAKAQSADRLATLLGVAEAPLSTRATRLVVADMIGDELTDQIMALMRETGATTKDAVAELATVVSKEAETAVAETLQGKPEADPWFELMPGEFLFMVRGGERVVHTAQEWETELGEVDGVVADRVDGHWVLR